jgi:hypothetical protein
MCVCVCVCVFTTAVEQAPFEHVLVPDRPLVFSQSVPESSISALMMHEELSKHKFNPKTQKNAVHVTTMKEIQSHQRKYTHK